MYLWKDLRYNLIKELVTVVFNKVLIPLVQNFKLKKIFLNQIVFRTAKTCFQSRQLLTNLGENKAAYI